MNEHKKTSNEENIEVRCFGSLKKFADEKGWPFPYIISLNKEWDALELAKEMGLPTEKIEGVFINGVASPIDKGRINPGDRVGFIPYGIPGPYRVLLGIRKNDGQEEA